jgi:hypothetical protein
MELLAKQYSNLRSPCLESCLSYIVADNRLLQPFPDQKIEYRDLVHMQSTTLLSEDLEESDDEEASAKKVLQDRIPSPRLCGAVFCMNGKLAVFYSSLLVKKSAASTVLFPDMPKSLDEFQRFQRTLNSRPWSREKNEIDFDDIYDENVIQVSHFLQSRQNSTSLNRNYSNNGPFLRNRMCYILDFGYLLPFDIDFEVKDDPIFMCEYNSEVSKKKNSDNYLVWELLKKIVMKTTKTSNPRKKLLFDPGQSTLAKQHPFGENLLRTIIRKYEKEGNIQMLALIGCVFHMYQTSMERDSAIPLKLINVFEQKSEGRQYETITSRARSGSPGTRNVKSLSFNFELLIIINISVPLIKSEKRKELKKCQMFYAELLYQRGEWHKRIYLLKCQSHGTNASEEYNLEYSSLCYNCNMEHEDSVCGICKKYGSICVICHLSIKGKMFESI